MSVLSRVKTWLVGDTLTAADLNAEFNNIVNDYNGGITNANISASAGIDATKISGTAATLTGTETLSNKTLTDPLFQGVMDGWVAANETWTYASATTFTVAADVTEKYQKGDKIKLTQTTVKYFYVVSTSYSEPNTTVTVTGGTDYALANAAITNPYYSHEASPQGFPTWFSYTPTASPQTGSITAETVTGKFMINGRSLFVMVSDNITNKGTWVNQLFFSLPCAVDTTFGSWAGYANAETVGTTIRCYCDSTNSRIGLVLSANNNEVHLASGWFSL